MEVIVILDFFTGQVDVKKYTGKDNVESWLYKEGYDPDECQWMITESLNLNINL